MDGSKSQTDEQAPEAERALRRRVLKGALVAINHEFSSIPCTMRNLSDTGTRLDFEDGWFVPDRFFLFVDVDGYKIECERVWQKGKSCGVRFVGPKIPSGPQRQQALSEDHPPDEAAARPADSPARRAASPAGPAAPPPAHGERKSGGFGRRVPDKS
ncbi:PilZ domain-containing protein [Hoeflea marina]|uniref:PilZ domain-containing protein n=1 Tax=Hoeflea marina TaxID=274592 RepID=A0A317PVT8_9HYPH|nr:PilZ domain-containing protein [Hoeflea marina]PWW04396.1 PilZ domain-containing protein [Hoeflea marina]